MAQLITTPRWASGINIQSATCLLSKSTCAIWWRSYVLWMLTWTYMLANFLEDFRCFCVATRDASLPFVNNYDPVFKSLFNMPVGRNKSKVLTFKISYWWFCLQLYVQVTQVFSTNILQMSTTTDIIYNKDCHFI